MRMLILVVEDDPVASLDLCDIAQAAGCVTVAAFDFAGARAAASEYCFDLALIDLHLGRGEDGAYLARELLQRWNTPAVIVSGHLTDTRRTELLDVALFALSKPFAPDALRAAIFAAIEPRNDLLA